MIAEKNPEMEQTVSSMWQLSEDEKIREQMRRRRANERYHQRILDKVNRLEQETEALASENEALTSKNETLTFKIGALTSKNDALTSKNEALTSENEALRARLAQYEKQYESDTDT